MDHNEKEFDDEAYDGAFSLLIKTNCSFSKSLFKKFSEKVILNKTSGETKGQLIIITLVFVNLCLKMADYLDAFLEEVDAEKIIEEACSDFLSKVRIRDFEK